MIAYKFTNPGRRSKYGVTDYPEIGKWSEKRVPILCRSGWHVPVLLSEWINTELWKVEVKGKFEGDNKKTAWEQVRFLERVEDWNRDMMKDFIVNCCNRPDAYSVAADDAAAYAYAYASAAADDAAADDDATRRYQHNWIVGRLNLGSVMEVPA